MLSSLTTSYVIHLSVSLTMDKRTRLKFKFRAKLFFFNSMCVLTTCCKIVFKLASSLKDSFVTLRL